ncbi:pol polyprotein-like protein, partial [Leptotrombidium deliense]
MGAKEIETFETLKKCLLNPPVLVHYDPDCDHELHTDASNVGIGAVLMQVTLENEKRTLHPVAYISRSLSKAEINYSTVEKECLAIRWAIEKFRQYIFGRKFKVVSDHHSLCWLLRTNHSNPRLCRWSLFFQEYDFTIEHKSGCLHQAPDCLSRHPVSPEPNNDDLFVFEICDIGIEQLRDTFCSKIISRLKSSKKSEKRLAKKFTLIDNVLHRTQTGSDYSEVS